MQISTALFILRTRTGTLVFHYIYVLTRKRKKIATSWHLLKLHHTYKSERQMRDAVCRY